MSKSNKKYLKTDYWEQYIPVEIIDTLPNFEILIYDVNIQSYKVCKDIDLIDEVEYRDILKGKLTRFHERVMDWVKDKQYTIYDYLNYLKELEKTSKL